MSSSKSYSTSSAPVAIRNLGSGIPRDVAAGAAAATGAALVAAASLTFGAVAACGRETVNAVHRITELARAGNYPGMDNLHLSVAHIGDLNSYGSLLAAQGFDLTWHDDVVMATAASGEHVYLFADETGVGVVSDDRDLIEVCQQAHVASEFSSLFEASGYAVDVDISDGAAVISVSKPRRDMAEAAEVQPSPAPAEAVVTVWVDDCGEVQAEADSRSASRPECDIIQQLIQSKLSNPVAGSGQVRRPVRAEGQIEVRRGG